MKEFDVELMFAMAIIVVALIVIVFYLFYINAVGGRSNKMRLSQIILQKQYKKMRAEKIVAISIGRTIQKNAPIKYVEMVEGCSDEEVYDESP